MKTSPDKLAQFSKILMQKIEIHDFPRWMRKMNLKGFNEQLVIFDGIEHEAYWFDIQRNHTALLRDVLEEAFPGEGPFKEQCLHMKGVAHFHSCQIENVASTNLEWDDPEPGLSNWSQNCSSVDIHSRATNLLHPETSDAKVKKKDMHISSGGIPEPDFQFTLQSFIAGERNLLASKACQVVTEMPGKAFNPLVIHGVTGSGKTHLLQGIGRELKEKHSDLKVVYVTAEHFLNRFIHSLRNQGMEAFRKDFRNAEFFLVDDFDLLGNTKQAQNELLHTLNHLRQRKKQIVITCRVHPFKIEGLSDVLKNRLESGLVLDIGIPDSKTRMEILVSKAEDKGIPLPHELAEFMARNISGSVERLEGALLRLGVHSTLLNEPLSIELARMNLSDLLGRHVEELKHQQSHYGEQVYFQERILSMVSAMFQVSPQDLCSKRREQRVVKARQAAIYLFRETTHLSLSEIARLLCRTHSTVHSSLSKVYRRMKEDTFFRRQLHQLRDELNQAESSSTFRSSRHLAGT